MNETNMRNEVRNILLLLAKQQEFFLARRRLHTFINDWCFVTIVNQARQFAQVVFVGQRFVMNLYEADSKLIRLVVDVLKLLKGLGALATLGFV